MFDEPNEGPKDRAWDPAQRAKEKSDELRMYAELHAIFEAPRKFDAALLPGLDDQLARDIQRRLARLDKSKSPDSPILPGPSAAEAAALLSLPGTRGLAPNDFHIYRRPGEVMIVRWLEGDQVETFYERMQAHFDVAVDERREEERQAHGWKQDPKTLAYLAALDAMDVKMADRYLRDVIRKHNVFVLSTLTADEIDILYLCEHVMGVPAAEVVGAAAMPPEEPTERDRAWFLKLFSLRGMNPGVEQMCFFSYLQKSDDTFDSA
jgi:hypothetical protein